MTIGFRRVHRWGMLLGIIGTWSGALASTDPCVNALIGKTLAADDIEARVSRILEGTSEAVQQLQSSIQYGGLANATYNWKVRNNHNSRYSLELPVGTITNQASSGRCWIFSGLNLVRGLAIASKVIDRKFELSENFTYFYSMLERSNKALESDLDQLLKEKLAEPSDLRDELAASISDGGWFEWFAYLSDKYGIVPLEAMPDSKSATATAELQDALKNQLAVTTHEMHETALAARAKDARAWSSPELKAALREIKGRGIDAILSILVAHLGAPPTEVKVGSLRMSPRDYARDVLNFHSEDYVSVGYSALSGLQFGVAYRPEDSGVGASAGSDTREGQRVILNAPLERVEALVQASLKAGVPVPFAADISASRDTAAGIGILNSELYNPRVAYGFLEDGRPAHLPRDQARYYKAASVDHAMLFIGMDQPDPREPVVKYKVENSWGKNSGQDGYLAMYRNWFYENMYVIVVKKSLLSERERKALEAKPIVLKDGKFF